MKDCENELFTIIATALRTEFPEIFVTGEAISAPSKFPCVAFYEDDNYISREDMDSADHEVMATLRYRCDVYSNKSSGKKSEVKAIQAVIEPILYLKNFTRFSKTPLNDMGDKIYHSVGTYRVKTDGVGFYRI